MYYNVLELLLLVVEDRSTKDYREKKDLDDSLIIKGINSLLRFLITASNSLRAI